MLIVFGGLPGTGKTTISRELAKRLSATLLRIDVIEQALLASLLVDDIGVAGYSVANALAEANLSNGQTVVADCVNPVEISRAAWKTVAARTKTPLIQIEVVCTDRTEHRRRVEARKPDIPGHVLPTWETVVNYTYETWKADLVLDSSKLSTDEAVTEVLDRARQMSRWDIGDSTTAFHCGPHGSRQMDVYDALRTIQTQARVALDSEDEDLSAETLAEMRRRTLNGIVVVTEKALAKAP